MTPLRRAARHGLRAGFAGLLAAFTLAAGCAALEDQGALAVVRQPEPGPRLVGDFDRLRYRVDAPGEATFVFTQGPPATATQAAVVRLYWTPVAGGTALSATGTNCSIQYLVFADALTDQGPLREVGVYHGAGFLRLEDEPGAARLTGAVRDATLALSDRSDRFRDLLQRSRMTGAFTADLDAPGVADALARLNRRVNARLGYPRLIDTRPLAAPDTETRIAGITGYARLAERKTGPATADRP
ncbi:MAG: hypothetical protein AAGA57_10650 [Planctomycetota bacterium]